MQPYHAGTGSHRQILGIISRLENADKHRRLNIVGGMVQHLVATISVDNVAILEHPISIAENTFAREGTNFNLSDIAIKFEDGPVIQASEMHMEFTGTAKLLNKITGPNETPSDYGLRITMLEAISQVRYILRTLEPFVVN